jgi:hypothetical protein
MQLSLTAYASKATSQDGDDEIEWSQPKKGILTIDNEAVVFEDWSIPATSIDKASLDTVRMLHLKRQYLELSCGDSKFKFTLWKPIDKTFNFPFEITETTKHSMPNKLIIGATIFFLINIFIILIGVWLKAN